MSQQTHRQDVTRRDFAGAAMAAAAALVALPVSLASAEEGRPEDEPITFSCDATSKIQAVTDIADISFKVETSGETADEAQTEAARIVSDATGALVDAGIPEDQVHVSNLSIWPVYTYKHRGLIDFETYTEISGYEASVSMSVTSIGVDQVGDAIAAATGAGVNRVSGVSYSCSTYEEVYDLALTEACQRASHKAEVAAAALGCEITGISDVDINYENSYYQVSKSFDDYEDYEMADMAEADAAMAAPAISFEPETVEIYASVDVIFYARKI